MEIQKSDNTTEPFIRGILAHHLMERGMNFEKAFQIAKDTKVHFAKKKKVHSHDLSKAVDQLISKRYGKKLLNELKPPWFRVDFQITVKHPTAYAPFSKGMLAQSITSSGVSPDEAYSLALEIEGDLVRERCEEISNEDLYKRVGQKIQDSTNKDIADLYFLSSRLDQLDRPVVIIIGGASGVGKSALATSMAHRFGINQVIGTDSIREIMRLVFSKAILPSLHESSANAGQVLYMQNDSAQQALAGFHLQSEQVDVGIQAVIKRAIQEKNSMVVEGVHTIPALTRYLSHSSDVFAIPVIINMHNENMHAERFKQRTKSNPHRKHHAFRKHFQEIRMIHHHYLEFAVKEDIDLVNNEDFDEAMNELMQTVLVNLREQVRQIKKKKDG